MACRGDSDYVLGKKVSDEEVNFVESLNVQLGSSSNFDVDYVEKDGEERICTVGHDNGENDGYSDNSDDMNSEGSDGHADSSGSEGDDDSEDEDDHVSPTGELVCDAGDDGSDHEDDEFDISDINGPPREVRVQEDSVGSKALFMVGETFANKHELVRAIDDYAINGGVKLRLVKSEPWRVQVKCQKGCPFVLYASKDGSNPGLVVKTVSLEHSCSRVFKNPRATVKWLSAYFRRKVQEKPKYSVSDMKTDVEIDLKLNVSKYKCKRAKRLIMEELEGGYIEEFNNLEAYCNELKISNPGSDVSMELSKEALENGKRVFSRLYLCFHASKTGWKAGCRPIIGVDGTFLKGKARGILLTAIGLDADDSLFPIAMAITQKENTLNWRWFLHWLKRSLDLENGQLVTIMSDMQKGLLVAVSEVLPDAEHRLCARHIYANWSKRWRGNELKKKFFSCAWSTFEEQFKDNLKAMGSLSREAAEAAISYPPKCWVRAYFSCRCLSWIVDNNLSESFNAWIDELRYLPIISMIDGIRIKLMTKWADSEKNVSKWRGNLSPKCVSLFEDNKKLAMGCRVFYNGDDGYEVTERDDRHTVFINRKKCTCRTWDLTGIPCQHAICALYHANIDPVTQISRFFHKDTYLSTYRTKYQPVRGKKFWGIDRFHPMEPPPLCIMPGRPRKSRIRTEESVRRQKPSKGRVPMQVTQECGDASSDLPPPPPDKLSKRGSSSKCSVCHQTGHNRATCRQAQTSGGTRRKRKTTNISDTPSEEPPQPSRPRGGRAFYRSRNTTGMGIHVDVDSGRTIYNPGMRSEVVIDEGAADYPMQHDADVETRFPIPNESELRTTTVYSNVTQTSYRSIEYRGDGCTSSTPHDLPYSPPGLTWRSQQAITTSRLLAERDNIIAASRRNKAPPIRGRGRGGL